MTALSILRLIPASGKVITGKIIFQGGDLLTKSEQDMKQIRGNLISMIFQNPRESLNPVFKMGEQLEAICRVHHPKASKQEISRRALEMIQSVGMPDPLARMEAYPHQLSGGMCQRFMIGMALVCNPKLLIADEPTTALDVTVQADVLDVISGLIHSKGASCLYITHGLGVVAQHEPHNEKNGAHDKAEESPLARTGLAEAAVNREHGVPPPFSPTRGVPRAASPW